jgi:D-alanyl-D-alanine carboxypeptidase
VVSLRLVVAAITLALCAARGGRVEARPPTAPIVRTAERLAHPRAHQRKPRSPEERTAREIERLLRGPLRGTSTALFVADAETGERLFAAKPDSRLNPASNVKLIATAAALDILGPDHRYRTAVLGDVPGDDGVIRDDLYLLGSYDPTLDRLGLDALAAQLVEMGTTRIDGDIVVGDPRSRDGVFRSFVQLSIQAGKPGRAPVVTMTPPNDLVEVTVAATTARTRRVRRGPTIDTQFYSDDDGHRRVRITVGGQVGRGHTATRTVWLRERALLGAHLLRQALRDRGVELGGDVQVATARDYLDVSLSRGFLPLPLAEHR